MFKRVFWFGVGTAAGAAGSLWAERKVRTQIDRARPSSLAGSARRTVRGAIEEGRGAARDRERQLRERLEPTTARRR